MILVSEIIAKLRTRLGDKDHTKYKWSDQELIDNINSSLIQLSIYLLTSTGIQNIKTKQGVNRYKLQENIVKVISINIDEEPTVIKSFEWMQNNKNTIDDDNFYVCMDEQSFYIYPKHLIQDDMSVEVAYNYIQKINDIGENIDMSEMVADAIVFYSMSLCMEVNTKSENMNKKMQYLNLFKDQIQMLKATFYKNKHSKRLSSKYKRI